MYLVKFRFNCTIIKVQINKRTLVHLSSEDSLIDVTLHVES